MSDPNIPHATEQDRKLIQVSRPSVDIYDGGKMATLRKAQKLASDPDARDDAQSNAGVAVGMKPHLIEKDVARDLRDFNSTHAICLDAKAASSLGLGHREQEIHETLDPLTRFSWQDTLDALAVDYWETGECFLEVVFADEDAAEGAADGQRLVTGIHHLESARVYVELEQENKSEEYHYVVEGETAGAETIIMAKWGDLADLRERLGSTDRQRAEMNPNDLPEFTRSALSASGSVVNSEIIHIRQATNRSRYYGYPDYMSAVPSIELVQCMTQHEFDFYFNRGVPEFLLFLIGKNIGQCWDKIEKMIQSNQGLGNSHKTGGVHIPGDQDEVKVQVEKLAMEDAANSGFHEKSNTLDMRIATSHGMPPQLANIALPGKIGAANEGPNALLTFQQRKLGQAQKNFSRMFACTLGDESVRFNSVDGAPKALSADLFTAKNAKPATDDGVPQFIQPGNGFNTVLDGMTLGAQNTMASMREPMTGSGRNPEDGNLSGARDRRPDDPRATRGPGTGQ